MDNVRFARRLAMFALLLGTCSIAAGQSAPVDQNAQMIEQPTVSSDPLEPLPEASERTTTAVQSEVYDASGAEAARAEMAERFGIDDLAPGQFRWADSIPQEGNTRIIVSLTDQLGLCLSRRDIDRRDNGIERQNRPTRRRRESSRFWPRNGCTVRKPTKMHRCLSCSASTLTALPLHGGTIPGYPASHGCVRLPMKFAERLFTLTTAGSEVIITT